MLTVTAARAVYEHLGAPPDSLVHAVFEGEHRWDGSQAAAFLDDAFGA